MFGEEFFPTPGWIGHKMIDPLAKRIQARTGSKPDGSLTSILDPSAGDGALLDIINRQFEGSYRNKPRISAVEISPELAAILQGKGYDLVGHNFLEFQPDFRIDLIVMNPPFSDGPSHVLHAWEILQPAGELISLVMATNISRPHTKEMELLKAFVEQYGSFEDMGPAFAQARRPTEVPIGLIRMTKPKGTSKTYFDFGPMEMEDTLAKLNLETTSDARELAHPDRIGAVVNQYQQTRDAFVDVVKAQQKIRFFSERSCSEDAWNIALQALSHSRGDIEDAFEEFTDKIRSGFWAQALRQLGMEKYMTEDLRKKLDAFVQQQGRMAFNKENIERMYETLLFNRKGIMQQAIEAVFDKFTKYHEDNRCHTEGWASNLAWKVNRKIVLPFAIEWRHGGGLRIRYGSEGMLNDIDKVMCYLSGKRIEEIKRITTAVDEMAREAKSTVSTFFKINAFKKGTIHLEFLDEALWNRFNIEACQGKGWIGKE